MELDLVKEYAGLREGALGALPCCVHEGHRWILPIIARAQNERQLPKPVTLVMFDRFPDNRDPLCMDQLRRLRASGATIHGLVDLCQNHLSPRDDDWLIAAMELGLVGHVVAFGVDDRLGVDLREYRDHMGGIHHLEYPELPAKALEYGGSLGALDERSRLARLWGILGWRPVLPHGFAFERGLDRILLSLDLKCFTVEWRGYRFPWPEEVFEAEFQKPSGNIFVEGITGKGFMQGLISKAGLLAVAGEPAGCGGESRANDTLRKVNRYLFDGSLKLQGEPLQAGTPGRRLQAVEPVRVLYGGGG